MSWYGLADDERHTVHRAATSRQEGKPTELLPLAAEDRAAYGKPMPGTMEEIQSDD